MVVNLLSRSSCLKWGTISGGDFEALIEDEEATPMGQQAAKRLQDAQRKGKIVVSDHSSEALSVASSIEETCAQSANRWRLQVRWLEAAIVVSMFGRLLVAIGGSGGAGLLLGLCVRSVDEGGGGGAPVATSAAVGQGEEEGVSYKEGKEADVQLFVGSNVVDVDILPSNQCLNKGSARSSKRLKSAKEVASEEKSKRGRTCRACGQSGSTGQNRQAFIVGLMLLMLKMH
uniref:Uncharacterized protein n=1 Tax=Chenopodium quinoa TaxID=63459 RepID=A0A803KPV8_CHEQI